jgi:hypothetical protein
MAGDFCEHSEGGPCVRGCDGKKAAADRQFKDAMAAGGDPQACMTDEERDAVIRSVVAKENPICRKMTRKRAEDIAYEFMLHRAHGGNVDQSDIADLILSMTEPIGPPQAQEALLDANLEIAELKGRLTYEQECNARHVSGMADTQAFLRELRAERDRAMTALAGLEKMMRERDYALSVLSAGRDVALAAADVLRQFSTPSNCTSLSTLHFVLLRYNEKVAAAKEHPK